MPCGGFTPSATSTDSTGAFPLIGTTSRAFYPRTNAYDLGCSTATTLIKLCRELDESARLIGYDNSIPMLERARQKIKEAGLEHRIDLRCGDLNGELSELPLEDASMVTMCWTMQFIRPLRRDNLIRWIYSSLVENGALVVTDKILTNSTHINFETMVDRTEAVYTELLGAQVDVAGLRSIPYYPPGKIH